MVWTARGERGAAERTRDRPAPSHEPAPSVSTEAAAEPVAPLSRASVQLLQGAAGNAAVARLVAQRYAAPVSPSPSQAPGMRRVSADVAAKRVRLSHHQPAATESKSAQDAAVAPPDDKQAQGKVANSAKMDAAKPGAFDKAAFIKAVNDAIAAQAPKNLDDADKFSKSGKAEKIKGAVDGKVTDGKNTSAHDITTTTSAPPDTSAAKEKQVTPLHPDQPPVNPGAPSAADAAPAPQPAAVTDFSPGPKQTDEQMKSADVTDDQLAKSNEPDFTGALKDKKQVDAHSATAPGKARGAEKQQISAAKSGAAATGAHAMAQLTATRHAAGKAVDGGKGGAKSKDESRRVEATSRLQKVFDATKKDVEGILDGLDKKVDTQFNAGEAKARAAFEADQKARMSAYKKKRYGGWLGGAKWAKDKLLGMPKEANDLFQISRQLYVTQMQNVISSVADTIGTELGKAKSRIATGRQQLTAEVNKLPADLRKYGQDAAEDFAGKFDDLESEVNDKSKQLVQDLATKYTQALHKIDDEIKKLQDANKGLVSKAVGAIAGVIKTIMELKNLLMGVLAKAASAISKIIKNPIGFLNNLVHAVGAGLKLFVQNIADHLKKGLVSWLLGTAVKAGLNLPSSFDLKGIIQLITGLLGLTWANIRARITSKGIPDQAMTEVEKTVPVAQKLAKEGPAGVEQEIVKDVGDLKATILGKLTTYLIPTVIIAGITWILSLLNPASAFVRAVKAIIDIVSFVINQGAQVIEFVNAVLDAVIAIANGGEAGVPKMVETALAAAIPTLLGLLASLLGIGNLASKVKSVFHAVARPVNRVIDKIVGFIVKMGKKIWAKLKSKFGKGKNKDKHGKDKDDEKDAGSLRSTVRAAARRGWASAGELCRTQVVRIGALRDALGKAESKQQGATIKLDVAESGTSWHVRAEGSKGGVRKVTAEEGKGWIAEDGPGERWYAAQNMSSFNGSLIDGAFQQLEQSPDDDSSDLHTGYQMKVAAGQKVEQQQQARLDSKLKGMRFSVAMEPYRSVEKDKTIRTTIGVTPNASKKEADVPVKGGPFPFVLGEAQAPITTERLGAVRENVEHFGESMHDGKDDTTGFVVNMAALPKEVGPDVAARYLDQAWDGSDRENSALTRTAVVTGINTIKSLDKEKDEAGRNAVTNAISGVTQPSGLRMAVFGFQWAPRWKHEDGKSVSFAEVQQAFDRIKGEDGEARAKAMAEEGNLSAEKLPYGVFREEVLGSSYTSKLVDVLSKVNRQVHILSQDADGGVQAVGGGGVLTEYTRILSEFERHPLLTVGGYTFDGFNWEGLATSRTKQLTTLANAIDRAIRVAIAKLHPQMLYPTEPNMLIKASDRDHGDGVFQNEGVVAGLRSTQGSLYGIGQAEGRQLRNNLMAAYGGDFSMAYTPDAATVTSPLPYRPARGLKVGPEEVHATAKGEKFPDNNRSLHPMYALIVQSQSFASARTLAREYRQADPRLGSSDQKRLREDIFVEVEEVAKMMADNPSLTADSPEIVRRFNALDAEVEARAARLNGLGKAGSRQALEHACDLTKEIVGALTADELKGVWAQVKKVLDEVMAARRPSEGGFL